MTRDQDPDAMIGDHDLPPTAPASGTGGATSDLRLPPVLAGLADRVREDRSPRSALTPVALRAAALLRRERPDAFAAWVELMYAALLATPLRGEAKRLWCDALRDAGLHLRAGTFARADVVEPTHAPDAELPVIRLGVELARENTEAIGALGRHPDVYQRMNLLVRVVSAPGVPPARSDAPGAVRAHQAAERRAPGEGAPTVEAIPPVSIAEMLSSVAQFSVRDRRVRSGEKRVAPPIGLATAIASRHSYDPSAVRPLVGVVESPVLLPSARVLTEPGYDPESGLLLAWRGPLVEIDPAPTKEDAAAAASRIAELFADFVFQGGPEQRRIYVAGCIAAILTPLARHAIDGPVPAFVWDADQPNAGKTLAASVCGALVLGRPTPIRPWCDDSEEMQKTIGAVAQHAPPLALFDNVRTHVEGGALEAVLTTSDTYAARILGVSVAREVEWRTTLYLTANRASLSADMARRVIHLLMRGREAGDQREPYAHERLLAHALEHRVGYLRDALTILRGHAVAGRPAGAKLDTYEAWSEVVASAVLWAYGADPVLARPPAEANRDLVVARDVVAAWCSVFRDRPVTVAEALEAIGQGSPAYFELRDALAELARVPNLAQVSAKAVGKRLGALAERKFTAPWGGQIHLSRQESSRTAARYAGVSTSPIPGGTGR